MIGGVLLLFSGGVWGSLGGFTLHYLSAGVRCINDYFALFRIRTKRTSALDEMG